MADQTFLVVQATPNPDNAEDLQKYGAQSYGLLEKHGGVPVANYAVRSTVGDGDKPAAIAVFSFPDADAIQNLLVNDPDYQNIVPFRDKGFKDIKFFVCSA